MTVDLAYTNRPLQMIQGGYDAGVVAGHLTDDTVVARPAGSVVRYLVASPALVAKQARAKAPEDLREWPWLALTWAQFGGPNTVKLRSAKQGECLLPISPVLVSEGITSLREAARLGLGVTVLPDWLAKDDITAGRLVRVLPQWHAPELAVHVIYPGQRPPTARARAFVDFAVATMAKEIYAQA